jgi:hypothetical protein
VFQAQGGNVSSENNNNTGRNTQVNNEKFSALTKSIASYEAFIGGASGINSPTSKQLADLAAIKASIVPMSKSNAILARVNANTVSMNFDPFITVKNLLGQYNKQSVLNALAGKQGPEYNAIKTVLMRSS